MPQTAIPNINIEYYLALVVRRKWWIIVPVLLSILAGAVYIKITPKSYKANTLILVKAQKVPTSYVRPTVTESLRSRLHTITQQVYSRTNLEKIIEQFDLYADNGGKKPTAEMVENLRRKINVNLRGRGAGRAFQISFVWHDPKTVAGVTNAIASQFIEQNLKVREDMAMGTTTFLENETEKMRREIETREKNLEIFKRKHMGMLPDQLQSNLNILGQLKQELNNLEERMQAERKQFVMLQRQMKLVQAAQTQPSDLIEIAPDKPGETPSDDLTYLIALVRQLRLRYTEKHPDVIALKRKIALIQQTHAAGKDENGSSTPEPLDNPLASQKDQIKFQLDETNRNIESCQNRIREVKKEIQVYNNRIERIPEVQLELAKLTRDYSTIRGRYQSLFQKEIDARMAEQLERRQKGEQFQVLDPAIIPDKPFKPDIQKVLFMALIAGLGLGGGLAFLREIMAGAFYSPEDLESFLGTKVLVSIPLGKRNM